jgi:hypothetical protein
MGRKLEFLMQENKKDQDWLDILQGKEVKDVDPKVKLSAQLVRKAYQKIIAETGNVTSAHTNKQLAKLKARIFNEEKEYGN